MFLMSRLLLVWFFNGDRHHPETAAVWTGKKQAKGGWGVGWQGHMSTSTQLFSGTLFPIVFRWLSHQKWFSPKKGSLFLQGH